MNRGDFITVISWKYVPDQLYVGEVFEVLEVDDNLIYVDSVKYPHVTVLLNLNKVNIRQVDPEFVKLIKNAMRDREVINDKAND